LHHGMHQSGSRESCASVECIPTVAGASDLRQIKLRWSNVAVSRTTIANMFLNIREIVIDFMAA